MSVYTRRKASASCCKNGGKEEVHGKGGGQSWPYLASADNASRRCKWDKWSLSWWLDVARWWFAVNLTAFAVWPLPSRRCYCESGEHESERKREMNSYYIPQCIASPWPVLNWSTVSDCLSGTSAIERRAGKLIGSEIQSSYCFCEWPCVFFCSCVVFLQSSWTWMIHIVSDNSQMEKCSLEKKSCSPSFVLETYI